MTARWPISPLPKDVFDDRVRDGHDKRSERNVNRCGAVSLRGDVPHYGVKDAVFAGLAVTDLAALSATALPFATTSPCVGKPRYMRLGLGE
jgi:hypothetical protein